MDELIGIGLYTPGEASRLLRIPAAKLRRWLRGHSTAGVEYSALWTPEVDLGDGRAFLGFRDLMEARVVNAFISAGVSSIRIRRAIEIAQEVLREAHPLSTNRFRTDGREIFLQVIETDEKGRHREQLLNLFNRQYEFKGVIEPILKTVEFDSLGAPVCWWPHGHRAKIVLDPQRSFGQPIESASSVPTAVLAAAARLEGLRGAARSFDVTEGAVQRAVNFEIELGNRIAA